MYTIVYTIQPLERREERLLCMLTSKSMGLQRCSPSNNIFPHTVLYVFYALTTNGEAANLKVPSKIKEGVY